MPEMIAYIRMWRRRFETHCLYHAERLVIWLRGRRLVADAEAEVIEAELRYRLDAYSRRGQR